MDNFKWSDSLVKEYLRMVTSVEGDDYWQQEINKFKASKQPKPDWEIVSVSGKGDTSWSCDKDMFQWYLNNGWVINQIKRLSDGEVFTIGEKISLYPWVESEKNKSVCLIAAFLKYDELELRITLECVGRKGLYSINNLYKVKEPVPLFTTQDGLTLYNKDQTVYSVCPKYSWETKDNLTVEKLIRQHPYAPEGYNKGFKSWLHFSSENLRAEYILMNKPSLSLKEIEDNRVGYKNADNCFLTDFDKLIKLVQSKL